MPWRPSLVNTVTPPPRFMALSCAVRICTCAEGWLGHFSLRVILQFN
jgi:hypothetical protein